MDRLVSIPKRVCLMLTESKQLTPVSPDVFVSIPVRVFRLLPLCMEQLSVSFSLPEFSNF
jgi:hypothetical protein